MEARAVTSITRAPHLSTARPDGMPTTAEAKKRAETNDPTWPRVALNSSRRKGARGPHEYAAIDMASWAGGSASTQSHNSPVI